MTMPRLNPHTMSVLAAIAVSALLLTVLVAGCSRPPAEAELPATDLAPPPPEEMAADEPGELPEAEDSEAAAAEDGNDQPAAADEDAGSADGNTLVKIRTNKGEMIAELYDDKMPITAGNFLLLIDQKFYDGLTFHRVVPDFVIQGGDPAGNGSGGPGWAIPLEKPGEVHHERAILSMARAEPLDSAGSQFFVCLSNNESVQSLDTLMGGYAAFGKVTEGMDVADSIRVGDRIESITIVSESERADDAREASKKARL